jgi:hypothetical protein
MRAQKKRAVPAKEKAHVSKRTGYYQNQADLSTERRVKIARRLESIPKIYRGIYDRAITGQSLRAAINAFCLECVQWQREEVRLCTDSACPLWAVRPYQADATFPQDARDGEDYAPESTNASNKVSQD